MLATMAIKNNDKTLSPFAAPTVDRSKWRQALPQILAVCVKNVLLLGFGMTIGFPTILIPSLSSNNPDETFHLGQEAISWIGSINLICVPIGCLLSGAITQPIGRKRAMQFVNIPFVIAWLLLYFCKDIWQVYLALAITGLTGGLMEAPVLTFVAEIAQPHLRGMLASSSSMSVVGGIVFQFLLGTFLHWRSLALVNCIVPTLSFTLLFFIPETPVWLIKKNRFLDARKSLAWLRGWTSLNEIELEFQDLCKQLGKANDIGINNPVDVQQNDNDNRNILNDLKLFTKKNFVWPFSIIIFTFFLGHFNGMTTLQTYAIKIFAALKSPIDNYYATVIMGIVQVLGTILCVTLIHFIGKRLISFISLLGTGCCFTIVATYAYWIDVNYLDIQSNNSTIIIDNEQFDYNWIPVLFLILAAFSAQIGIRILPWILIGEVFSTDTRAHGSGFSAAGGYILGFVSNKIFLTMIQTLTLPITFWLYAIISFIGTIVLYFTLPETEGKTLHEITEHFAGNSKLDNKVWKPPKEGEVNLGFKVDDRDTRESRL